MPAPTHQLEDFLIAHCFYSGLLRGKLDQSARRLQVGACSAPSPRLRRSRPPLRGAAARAVVSRESWRQQQG